MRQFPASPITALIDEKPRYNLGESVAPDLTVAELLGSAGLADLAGVKLGYGTSAGSSELRALVAARHEIAGSQVLITTGAAAALFLVALLVGDGEILIGRPCYPPAFDAVQGLGARAVTVTSWFEDGYRIDLDAFAAKLSSRTRLVSVASPQNPSGVAFRQDEIEWMLAAMSRTCPEALLLIDETYREATYGDAVPAATFAGMSPRVLTCGSLSKAHGAPGLRIGWFEGGIAWIPPALQDAEHVLASYQHMLDHPLEHDIQYYWDTHMSASFMVDPLGLRLIEQIGVDKVMWASDYPHPDGVWPNSLKAVERQMQDLSPEMRQKLTHDNAARLYGLA